MVWAHMAVKYYVVGVGGECPESILGVSCTSAVNIVAFSIAGGVISPSEVPEALNRLQSVAKELTPNTSVVLSGRGPLWFYGALASVFSREYPEIAVWYPREKRAVIVHSREVGRVGRMLGTDGSVQDSVTEGDAIPVIRKSELSNKTVVHFRLAGGTTIQPSTLLSIRKVEIPRDKPVVIEGPMPVWVGARLTLEYLGEAPAVSLYDPRIGGAVVVHTKSKDYTVGSIIPVTKDEVMSGGRAQQTRVLAILGDPNSGKSVGLHLLKNELKKMGLLVMTQEGDLVAPTQEWSLFSPTVRRSLKKEMDPEKRLLWTVESIRRAKNESLVDIVLVDVGGGRPDLGVRVTRENMAILANVDGVIFLSRNDEGQVYEWLKEVRMRFPEMKVYGILESRLRGSARYYGDGVGVVVGLDRELYARKSIPESTLQVFREIAGRVSRDEYVLSGRVSIERVKRALSRGGNIEALQS